MHVGATAFLLIGAGVFSIVRHEQGNPDGLATGKVYFTIVHWWYLVVLAFWLLVAIAWHAVNVGVRRRRTWFQENAVADFVFLWLFFPAWSYVWMVFWLGAVLAGASVAVLAAQDAAVDTTTTNFFINERVMHVLNAVFMMWIANRSEVGIRHALLRQNGWLVDRIDCSRGAALAAQFVWHCIVLPLVVPTIYVFSLDVQTVYGVDSGITDAAARAWALLALLMLIGIAHTVVLFYNTTHEPEEVWVHRGKRASSP